MPKKKGSPKTGGRQKGTSNKRSEKLDLLLEDLNFDPVKEFIGCLENLSPDNKAMLLLKFMEFVYPKAKHSEVPVAEEIAPKNFFFYEECTHESEEAS